ncbi:DNA polymerase sliding clamp [Halogeometricum luteum]|uniref:DNA polymerase sliding clamp n=1 Tax=Halogeometricum luteum TaxID=2950537 RepID=A0ABU2G869_9EURY|nr:DNA polymerase sliding clamp [Halogeometricum sp. S3BR5-2]MDS0296995.1 DNA polymerase sliding clamp [Halogeometricum sp. S3BR5-2]
MSTEPILESADTDDTDDSTVNSSATSQQDDPTTDQSSDDETSPASEQDETDEPTSTGPPETFRAAIQSEPLKNILRALRATVDEARVNIDESGIRVRAVDPANVAMDDLDLSASAFESFEATPGVIGIDLDRLWDAVSLANKGDLVQLHLDTESRKLVVAVTGLEFQMACLDPATIRSEPTLPELELPASVTVDRDTLRQGVKAADLVADHVGFRMDPEEEVFRIDAEGDTDSVDFGIDADDWEAVTLAEASSLFSLDYMKRIVRTIPKGESVTVDFGTEFPAMLSHDIADGNGSIVRMLAPRIET